ncbi:MAG: transglutaminase-like domain-containing protein [Ruminococcus sp.]|nr:transglutaminase-like domain-containing protein [Ruminococcus sp.]
MPKAVWERSLDINMELTLYTNDMAKYLEADSIVDFRHERIVQLAEELAGQAENKTDYIRAAYEYVRDRISHSADIGHEVITCSASEVLLAGHGICFAKSHLLAALLRVKGIPAGFCYQKLILDDETAPILICHGLNGVYIEEHDKWIRLDARGNKAGVNACFSIESEQLAFPVRPQAGEQDIFVVYPEPDKKVLEKLQAHTSRSELWIDLPTEMEYKGLAYDE